MFSEQDFILTPPTVKVRVALAPVYNVLNSLLILNVVDIRSGLAEWAYTTYHSLSPEAKRNNQHLNTFFNVIQPRPDITDFPTYIDDLASQDAADLVRRYTTYLSESSVKTLPPDSLLGDRATFVSYVQSLYGERYGEKGIEDFDADYYTAVYDLLQHPDALKDALVSHLRYMWQQHLAAEWQHNLPLLEATIASFAQVDLNGLTALEAIRAVTGRDLTVMWDRSEESREYVFVPSAHIGPYISNFRDNDVTYVLFGARPPEGIKPQSNTLSRADLLVQLNALADETRLAILQLLTHHAELCAQDIITLLNLSQSSASRHLRQLTASGYLIERRREVNKCYSLNRGRVQETALALLMFLGLGAS